MTHSHNMTPSTEQEAIIRAVLERKQNVIVTAVPGSGKTTTVEFLVERIRKRHHDEERVDRILLLTYSRRLMDESAERFTDRQRVDVKTFHAFASQHYCTDGVCRDDITLDVVLTKDERSRHLGGGFAIIVVDEVQDMTPRYFRLLLKIMRDHSRMHHAQPKLLLLGDVRQTIYEFQKADHRFLTHAPEIWKSLTQPTTWTTLPLCQSFRLPRPIASFVNLISQDAGLRIESQKESAHKPRYLLCNNTSENSLSILRDISSLLLDSEEYSHGDFFILTPSIRCSPKHPVKQLANLLTRHGIKVCAAASDDEKLNSDVMHDKVVISTYHQAKGLERKVVIIFGMDQNYFKYYDRDNKTSAHSLPNPTFVAATRALERLIIVHDLRNPFMECVKNVGAALFQECDVILLSDETTFDREADKQIHTFDEIPKQTATTIDCLKSDGKDVTESLRFLDSSVVQDCMDLIEVTVKTQPMKALPCKAIVGSRSTKDAEAVSEITGTAIPFDYRIQHGGLKSDEQKFFDKAIASRSTDSLLEGATRYCANRSGLMYKTVQIRSFDWLPTATRESARSRIAKLFSGKTIRHEKKLTSSYTHPCNVCDSGGCELESEINNDDASIPVHGYADAIDDTDGTIYELKFTESLTAEHVLQLAMYMHMGIQKNTMDPHSCIKGILYNARTDELRQINVTKTNLDTIWNKIHGGYEHVEPLTDEEFVLKYDGVCCQDYTGNFPPAAYSFR